VNTLKRIETLATEKNSRDSRQQRTTHASPLNL
jgi:hypothetical protein